jgi:hypothetical protein
MPHLIATPQAEEDTPRRREKGPGGDPSSSSQQGPRLAVPDRPEESLPMKRMKSWYEELYLRVYWLSSS